MSPDVDVLVVGGGPVGLAAAIGARAAGFEVAVVEPREAPTDKACGEGLMPGAVAALARIGVRPHGRPFLGIRYLGPRRSVDHAFRSGPGLGVRRTSLHEDLARTADSVGVQRIWQRATEIGQDATGVSVDGVRARWLLGCDGLHSRVRAVTGLDREIRWTRARPRRFGLRRHYVIEPWADLVEVHWGPRAEAYVTPVGPHLVGVAVLVPAGVAFDQGLAEVPALARRLTGAAPAGPVLGAGPLRQASWRRSSGRVLLVGDAAGYVDALTGEGIRVGLAQAEAAVEALVREDPAGYERAWVRATRSYRLLTSGVVAAAASPLRPAIVPAAVALPGVFGAIVEQLAR